MSKKLLILSLLILMVTAGYMMKTSAEPNVAEIIKHSQEKFETIHDFKGMLITTTVFQGQEVRDERNISIKKPYKIKSEDKNKGIITTSNGEAIWIYDSKKSEVIKSSLERSGKIPDIEYGQLSKDLLKDNHAVLIGLEELSGISCYVIKTTPKNNTDLQGQKIWVDKTYLFPIKIENSFEGYTSSMEFANLSFNTGISDVEFEFSPPEGVKIIKPETNYRDKLSIKDAQIKVNFTILEPTYTLGYEFNNALVSKIRDVEGVTLIYQKDGKIIMIVQTTSQKNYSLQNAENISIGELKGEFTDSLGGNLLRFNYRNIDITITGTISKEELIKVAESIK